MSSLQFGKIIRIDGNRQDTLVATQQLAEKAGKKHGPANVYTLSLPDVYEAAMVTGNQMTSLIATGEDDVNKVKQTQRDSVLPPTIRRKVDPRLHTLIIKQKVLETLDPVVQKIQARDILEEKINPDL